MSAKRTQPKLSSVDLHLLVALDALMREGNVTAAGRRIGLSQPAMSHALARLRDVLGNPLLVREGRVLRLTSLAERLAPRVQRLIGEIDATLLGQRAFEPESSTRTFASRPTTTGAPSSCPRSWPKFAALRLGSSSSCTPTRAALPRQSWRAASSSWPSHSRFPHRADIRRANSRITIRDWANPRPVLILRPEVFSE